MRQPAASEFAIVTLKVEDRPDAGLSVTSDDVPGLLLSGADRELIWSVVALSVERLLRVNKNLDSSARCFRRLRQRREAAPTASPFVWSWRPRPIEPLRHAEER